MERLNVMGKILIVIGGIIILIGGVLLIFNKLPYIGKLPGDIYIKKDNFTFYFPITTCILVSIVLSLLLYLIGKLK